MRARWLLLGLLGCAAAIGAPKSKAKDKTAAAAAKVHTVAIDSIQYNPATLEVAVGDTVEWENKDLVPHTATEATASAPVFDTGVILAGAKARVVIKKAGELAYGCRFHPTMKGALTVKDAGKP